MARTVTVKIGATEWHMPASYKASREIAEAVGDPLKLALAAESGTIELSTEDIVNLIYIGCKHAGCSLSKDQIGESIFEERGPADYIKEVGQYLGALVSGGPERPVSGAKKKQGRGSKR